MSACTGNGRLGEGPLTRRVAPYFLDAGKEEARLVGSAFEPCGAGALDAAVYRAACEAPEPGGGLVVLHWLGVADSGNWLDAGAAGVGFRHERSGGCAARTGEAWASAREPRRVLWRIDHCSEHHSFPRHRARVRRLGYQDAGLRRDHYRTLGIERDADVAVIKRAYRKLARRYHPDVNPSADAAHKMVEVNEAYRTLSSATLRGAYDARLRRGIPDAPPPRARASGEVLITHHLSVVDLPSPVYAACFSPSSRQLAVACFDNSVRCVDVRTGGDSWEVALSGGVVSELRWLSRDRLVAAGASDKTVSSWLIRRRELAESRTRRIEWVSQVAISPDGRRLAMGGVDSTVAVMDRRSGKVRFSNRWHESSVVAVAFSSDGRLIASGGNDHRIVLMESGEGIPLSRLESIGAEAARLAFSPDDSLLAAALVDRSVRIYEVRTGMPRKAFWGHEAGIETLAFHPNGWLLASCDRKGQTRIWNAMGGKAVEVLGGHKSPIKAAVFSPNGKLFAVGGLDRSVSIWQVDVGEARRAE